MTSEQEKGDREVAVFRLFLEKSGMLVDPASIEKRLPPEPDIFCVHTQRGGLAFELVEFCDPEVAQLISKSRTEETNAFWTTDPSPCILNKKLGRTYETAYPIELLCYVDDRLVTPDDVILSTLRPILDSCQGPFQAIWFLGNSGVHIIGTRANLSLKVAPFGRWTPQ